jgi:hypothetical protein
MSIRLYRKCGALPMRWRTLAYVGVFWRIACTVTTVARRFLTPHSLTHLLRCARLERVTESTNSTRPDVAMGAAFALAAYSRVFNAPQRPRPRDQNHPRKEIQRQDLAFLCDGRSYLRRQNLKLRLELPVRIAESCKMRKMQ